MSPRTARGALLLAVATLVGGCRKEEAPPQEDRTLARLRDEVDRVNRGAAPAGPPSAAPSEAPNARLAGLAAGASEAEERPLNLPKDNPTVHVDSVAVKLTGLEAAHTLKGVSNMGLTTEEMFLRVKLVTENVGQTPAKLDLDTARVQDAEGKPYTIARDAQVLAGTRQLERTWEPGERTELVLVFEVPPSAVRAEALTLVLPAANGDIQLALR
ncbi:hypothetical protein P2318_26870 [Myxococcaceae bacterium GXIMD 01537]